jgi:hypothetical protein
MTDIAIRGGATTAGVFVASLVGVTALPFLVALSPESVPSLGVALSILALIHVPMTLYLLGDAEIRRMTWRHPVSLLGVPILLIAGSFAVFLFLTPRHQFAYWVLVAVWQNWHFGKQNIGVYSFVRAGERLGSMMPFERKLIVAGSVLGVLAAYFASEQYGLADAPRDIPLFWSAMPYLKPVAAFAQAVLLVLSVAYLVRHWLRMTPGAALIFMLSVNFFLPFYITEISLPDLFAVTVTAHGLQYLIVLLFHAGGSAHRNLMLGTFALLAAVLAELYYFHVLFPAGWLGAQVGALAGVDGGSLGWGLFMGVSLTHFWVDSIIWRLKDPESRAWVMSRYRFLFEQG